ncbi:CDT1-like protein a [Carex littledalei]|uniref:CDT1-like protein a n=1 Tax=Carex littledalei TaxID=544730 RepID=A0A833VIJ0_9POAL|nr:CDT1-like protein a [Carex littledalei]
MDQKDFDNENCPQTNLGFTSSEANNKKYPERFETAENSQSNFESPTPEKPDWGRKGIVITSLAKNLLAENFKDEKENSTELPDNYKILVDLFNKMVTSIRLLRLRKKTTSLKNISAQVDVLANRKLLTRHVAQMKYLLPDAVQIEKILSHDEETSHMYPDLKITLTMDFLESLHVNQSPSMALCKAFHTSVLKFVSLHPKNTEIPEAILPEPFNSSGKNSDLKRIFKVPSPQLLPTNLSEEPLWNASHLPSSFRKSTFQNLNVQVKTIHATELIPPQPEVTRVFTDFVSPLPVVKEAGVIASTPNREGKLADAVLMGTPAQQTPQRPLLTPSDKCASEKDDNKVAVNRSARKLNFQESEADGAISDVVVASSFLGDNEGCVSVNKTVASIGEEKPASLPSTFDAICLISQSKDCSLITKKELVYKILCNNLEIEETYEIEEHLATLEELFPEWICKKAVPNGEVFYRQVH